MADVHDPMKNSLWRREEQIKRWDLSETNKEPPIPRDKSNAKIKFQDGCVFLAACSSCDTNEVEKLLKKGADINTANIDGLTALHQVCIVISWQPIIILYVVDVVVKFYNISKPMAGVTSTEVTYCQETRLGPVAG